MVQARVINDTTSINVSSQSIASTVRVAGMAHKDLSGRDISDQHPISAITGLQELLNKVWTFTFEQEVASDTWVITHNLGRNPGVVAVDSAGSVQVPDDVHYDSENQITVKFCNAFAGKAFLN